MFSLVLSVCAAFGPSLSNEIPRAWENFYKAAQSAVSPQEPDWVTYYRNPPAGRIQYAPVFVSPWMQWAVPNSSSGGLLQGAPASAYPAFPGYGGFGGTEPPATPKK